MPASLPAGEAVPLVIGLHGGIGSGVQFADNSRFDKLAEANGFLVVYPDGVGTGLGGDDLRTWNAGACCGSAARQDVDDVAFLSALIDELAGRYRIDADRTYALGHSNGAMMSYRLACELSDKIVAIGMVSGSRTLDACEPSQPVSVIQVHGTGDQNVPIEGGTAARRPSRAPTTSRLVKPPSPWPPPTAARPTRRRPSTATSPPPVGAVRRRHRGRGSC